MDPLYHQELMEASRIDVEDLKRLDKLCDYS